MSVIDQIKQLRQLSESGDIIEGAITATEAKTIQALTEVRAEIKERQANDWRDSKAVREQLRNLPPEAQRRNFEQAIGTLIWDFVRIPVSYNHMALTGGDYRDLTEPVKQLIISMHNPVIQESILLAVDDEFQEDARAAFDSLAALLWGWHESTAGTVGPHTGIYLWYAAAEWGMSPEEMGEKTFDDPDLPERPPLDSLDRSNY